MARRPHGTGSVHYDKDRGSWVGVYEAGWTPRGTRRRRKVTGRTEREARRRLLEAQRQPETPTTTHRPTVRTWAEQWLTITQSLVRPTTWTNNSSAVRRWIIPTIGHRRLDLLTPADVRAVTRAILDAGRVPSTAQRAQVVLEKMLRDAIVEGHQVPQRVLMVEGPAGADSDRDAIELPDALAILAVASQRPDASRWVAAFLQAIRPAEALGLTWPMVDFDNHRIEIAWQLKALPYKIARDRSSGFRIPTGYTVRQLDGALHLVPLKTASGRRVIPMVPWMESALLAWRKVCPPSPHQLVWPRPDGRPGLDSLDRAAWVQIVDEARVARVDDDGAGRRYDLYEARHTTATLLSEAGVDDETIIEIMGHSSILSTKAYLHTTSTRTREALNAVAKRLGLSSPAPPLATAPSGPPAPHP